LRISCTGIIHPIAPHLLLIINSTDALFVSLAIWISGF
jgi:hypothetical protein